MNCTRRLIRVVSSQGIEFLPSGTLGPSSRNCHPSTRSDLLPMSPAYTLRKPHPRSLSRREREAVLREDSLTQHRELHCRLGHELAVLGDFPLCHRQALSL